MPVVGVNSPDKLCTELDCPKPLRAQGLCSTHYNRAFYGATRHERPAVCECCGRAYGAKRKDQRFCSLLCRSGGSFVGQWTEAHRASWREAQRRRRALLRGIETEVFTDEEIYRRDGWVCQLCRARVDPMVRWPDPACATLDHVIPLTEPGATHTRRNVRLAHLVCNTARGNRGGGEQLALIG